MKTLKLTLFGFLAAFAILLTSCTDTSDPCDDVTCLNGGECDDGNCDCPPGYFGSDCSSLDLEVSITIHSISVSNYPQTDNGNAWDDPIIGTSTPPDIQWRFTRANNSVISGAYFSDATSSTLTFPSSSTNLPLTILSPDVDEVNTLTIWDVDDLDGSDFGSSDDFMGGYDWVPSTFIDNDGNTFPSTIIVGGNGSLQFELEVSYAW
mmetsp:Transcript_16905/g.25823  ORF Transcript_16905/g.25823 Transcript_16905/m.25823 type:complete len:207 (+) Transcript_16905:16-636(+)